MHTQKHNHMNNHNMSMQTNTLRKASPACTINYNCMSQYRCEVVVGAVQEGYMCSPISSSGGGVVAAIAPERPGRASAGFSWPSSGMFHRLRRRVRVRAAIQPDFFEKREESKGSSHQRSLPQFLIFLCVTFNRPCLRQVFPRLRKWHWICALP